MKNILKLRFPMKNIVKEIYTYNTNFAIWDIKNETFFVTLTIWQQYW